MKSLAIAQTLAIALKIVGIIAGLVKKKTSQPVDDKPEDQPIEPCTWEEVDGRWICKATHCPHWSPDGCKLGKVTLVCDQWNCRWNDERFGRCKTMAVHLDANGKCMGVES